MYRQQPSVFNRRSGYLLLWVLTPLINALGEKTPYPNQIYVCLELLQVGLAALFFGNFVTMMRAQANWLVWLLAYGVVFVVVSYYGVDFATSVLYGVQYLPLIVTLEFFLAFTIGYQYNEAVTFRYMRGMALVLLAYTLLEIVLSPDQIRFVSTLNIPMAIPLFVFAGSNLLAGLCMLVLLLSLKKTVVVVGGFSLMAAILLKRYVRPKGAGRKRAGRVALISTIVTTVVALVGAIVILTVFSSYISATFDRFSEPEDVARSSIALYSYILLAEHFPWGIGWMGFLSQSIGVIAYDTTDARGDVHSGANLHNSYMTWALEGGVPIMLMVVVLFFSIFRVCWRFARRPETRMLSATLVIWLISGMVFGAFQQWHSSGTCWQLFGFAFGCQQRYRRQL